MCAVCYQDFDINEISSSSPDNIKTLLNASKLQNMLEYKFARVMEKMPEKMIAIRDLNKKMSLIASRYYGVSTKKIPIIGVTERTVKHR